VIVPTPPACDHSTVGSLIAAAIRGLVFAAVSGLALGRLPVKLGRPPVRRGLLTVDVGDVRVRRLRGLHLGEALALARRFLTLSRSLGALLRPAP
jgi:hypothetical protein